MNKNGTTLSSEIFLPEEKAAVAAPQVAQTCEEEEAEAKVEKMTLQIQRATAAVEPAKDVARTTMQIGSLLLGMDIVFLAGYFLATRRKKIT